MRFHRVFRVLFVLCSASWLLGCSGNAGKKCDQSVPDGVPYSCPDETKEPGTSQGKCRNEAPACDDGLICYAGACIPCGGAGETCCQPLGFFKCDPGISCDNTPDTDWPICKSCGTIGNECCSGDPCPNGGTCNDGTCETLIGSECFDGSTLHTVYIIDGECGSHPVNLSTDTVAEAESCAQELLALAQSDPAFIQPVEVGPIDTKPTETEVCEDVTKTFGTHYLWHFSQQQLDACKSHWCGNCPWADGKCPLAP